MIRMRTHILEQRSIQNMKQETLADLVHVRRETISRLEKGLYNPSLKLAYDIAHIFDMDVEEMFEFYDDSTDNNSK